jgi:hypothetical protein
MSFIKVQYRRVLNDVNVGLWEDWLELGTFYTLNQAMVAVKYEFGTRWGNNVELEDVSFDKVGIYQSTEYGNRFYQFRFVSIQTSAASKGQPLTESWTEKDEPENPWKVGLSEAFNES